MLMLALTALTPQLFSQSIPPEVIHYPELIVYNGKIVTMEDYGVNTNTGRTVQAMAIRGDKIMALGTNDEMLRFAGPQTKKLDVKGHTVVPGLINPHSHMHDHSLQLWVRRNPKKVEEVMKRFSVTGTSYSELTKGIELVIKEQMARPLPGQWAWIDLPTGGSSGTGSGIQYLIDNAMDREKLDALAPTLPVFILSHPKFLLNTAARNAFLSIYEVPPTDSNEKLALTQDTTINRSLVVDQYFRTHLDEFADALQDGLTHEAALGFTTFSSHIVGLRIHDAYLKLVRGNRMPIRFGFADRFCQQVEPDMAGCFIRKGDIAGLGNDYFWNVGVTLGGIDAGPPQICTTMEAPKEFKDMERCVLEPGNDYAKAIRAALMSRLRFVVNHNYGDKTMDYVMDIMEQVMKEDPYITVDYIRNMRLTSDHCGFYPRETQLPRMAKLGIMVSCGARSIPRSAPWLKVYGERGANQIVPVAGALKAGVGVVAEGEFQVEDGESETILAQYMPMITRTTDWGKVVAKQEAIDRVTLMKLMTVWSSQYVIKEKQLGSLTPGKFADFVVFNKDYFSVPEKDLPTVYPVMTVLGGKTIALRDEFAKEIKEQPVGPQLKLIFKTDDKDSDPLKGEFELGGEG
jgi:predicted amidohydrolase YtcJ